MKLIKHCHEMDESSKDVAQGALLGLVTDTRLEISHSFPFPTSQEEDADDEDFQLSVMRRLRMVNVDHLHVGWYQSASFGNFLSPQLLESHFAYQTSIGESVCLIFDTAKTRKGFLSLKAFRLTPEAIALFKAQDFSPESIRNLQVSYRTLFQEVPITIKNSHLVNELMLELSEQIPSESGSHFLDLGSSDVLEGQLKYLMETVDEFNQEAIRYNKFRDMTMKQYQDKMKYVQKRQTDNSARAARGKSSE